MPATVMRAIRFHVHEPFAQRVVKFFHYIRDIIIIATGTFMDRIPILGTSRIHRRCMMIMPQRVHRSGFNQFAALRAITAVYALPFAGRFHDEHFFAEDVIARALRGGIHYRLLAGLNVAAIRTLKVIPRISFIPEENIQKQFDQPAQPTLGHIFLDISMLRLVEPLRYRIAAMLAAITHFAVLFARRLFGYSADITMPDRREALLFAVSAFATYAIAPAAFRAGGRLSDDPFAIPMPV